MQTAIRFGVRVAGGFRAPLRVLVAGAVAIAFASLAHAIDGVVEISQAGVLASGGFPFQIAQPGSYRLTSDLVVASTTTDAIDATSGNVTIDLNGFSILGPGSGSGVGIRAVGQSQVTIRNGAVRDMGNMGLFLGNSCDVERMQVTNNGDTGVSGGLSCTIADNVVSNNGHYGISASGIVEGNTAIGNSDEGILAAGVIRNNTANGNFTGIKTMAVGSGSPADTATVVGNSANQNAGYGVFLDDGSGYEKNVLNDNFSAPTGTSDQVTGGTQIGPNLCNGALCP